jgi:putative salt-induced outer membrane protein YdiY
VPACAALHAQCRRGARRSKTKNKLPLAAIAGICSYAQPRRMSLIKQIIAPALGLLALANLATAQPTYVTVTNYVTVTVTNFVTLTNTISVFNTLSGTHFVSVTNLATLTNRLSATNLASLTNRAGVVTAAVKPLKGSKYPWTNSISGGLTLARGNTDTTLMSADFVGTKKTPDNEYTGTADVAYGEQDSKQTVDDYKASFRWDHIFTDRWYSYLRTDGLRDYISDVDYRFTLGPGVGYYLLKQTNIVTLAVGGGVNFEAQSLGNQGDTFATLRLADKFEYKINSHARIWQTVEFLPEISGWNNYLINFELGAEASLTKSFSLKSFLDDNFNSEPALDHVKNDVRLITAIAYKF